jgi:DsbC/DsbD-like thiol-disulfide interchange protein
VLYPAPTRLTDEAGDTIGYKDKVTFPVVVEPKDASRPVKLVLELSFGICKDICVPSEAAHELEIAPQADIGSADKPSAAQSLDLVPRNDSERLPGDPALKAYKVDASGTDPRLVIEASFPGGAEGADVFIEAPDGLYVPMLSRAEGGKGGIERFETKLGNALEPKDLAGKTLTATIVSRSGSSVATFKVD